MRVLGNRGSSIFEVESHIGEKSLATLPSKFKNLIWIKTGEYVLVYEKGNDTDCKEKHVIKNIFSKNNIKFLKKQGLWTFPEDGEDIGRDSSEIQESLNTGAAVTTVEYGGGMGEDVGDEGEEDEEDEDDMELKVDKMGNTICADGSAAHDYEDEDDEDEDGPF